MIIPSNYIEYRKQKNITFADLNYNNAQTIEFEDVDNIEKFNLDIEIGKYAPGYIAFATDGGNEIFAFDDKGRIFMIPMVGMSGENAVLLADSWKEFQTHIK